MNGRRGGRLSVPAALLGVAIVAWTVAVAHDRNSRSALPTAIPAALTAIALILATVLTRVHRSGWAFATTGLGAIGFVATIFTGPVSARTRRGSDVREQPDDLERRVRSLRAPGDHGRRGDLRAARGGVPGLDVTHVFRKRLGRRDPFSDRLAPRCRLPAPHHPQRMTRSLAARETVRLHRRNRRILGASL